MSPWSSKSETTELEKTSEDFRKETTPKVPTMLAQYEKVFTRKHQQGRRRDTKRTTPRKKRCL
jgi:hypothetical protein